MRLDPDRPARIRRFKGFTRYMQNKNRRRGRRQLNVLGARLPLDMEPEIYFGQDGLAGAIGGCIKRGTGVGGIVDPEIPRASASCGVPLHSVAAAVGAALDQVLFARPTHKAAQQHGTCGGARRDSIDS